MNARAARTLTDTGLQVQSSTADGYQKFRQAYDSPPRVWEKEVLRNLTQFLDLPQGWDGYAGIPVKWDAGMFALHILSSVMGVRTPPPQVVPTAVGGVQLEWHEKGLDLEIHVTGPYECEMWFQDHVKPQQGPVSADITNDFAALKNPIHLLDTR